MTADFATHVNKVISDGRVIKILAERNGLLVSLTTKTFSYLLFVSRPLLGIRKVVTKDRIVAKAGYDISRVATLISEFYDRNGPESRIGSRR